MSVLTWEEIVSSTFPKAQLTLFITPKNVVHFCENQALSLPHVVFGDTNDASYNSGRVNT